MPPAKPSKVRLDKLLVARGLCESRTRAQALILAGEVVVGDHTQTKAGTLVNPAVPLRLKSGDPNPYVSRGGLKLRGALDEFGLVPTIEGAVCMDVGASTGGFTDCLLQAGAARVYAIDVGYGQLAWKLVNDERVIALDRQNIRKLEPDQIPEPIDLGGRRLLVHLADQGLAPSAGLSPGGRRARRPGQAPVRGWARQGREGWRRPRRGGSQRRFDPSRGPRPRAGFRGSRPHQLADRWA